METLSYVLGSIEEVKVGSTYYFGQLCDGNNDVEELLESGSISLDNENVVGFDIVERDDDLLKTVVKVTDIY